MVSKTSESTFSQMWFMFLGQRGGRIRSSRPASAIGVGSQPGLHETLPQSINQSVSINQSINAFNKRKWKKSTSGCSTMLHRAQLGSGLQDLLLGCILCCISMKINEGIMRQQDMLQLHLPLCLLIILQKYYSKKQRFKWNVWKQQKIRMWNVSSVTIILSKNCSARLVSEQSY